MFVLNKMEHLGSFQTVLRGWLADFIRLVFCRIEFGVGQRHHGFGLSDIVLYHQIQCSNLVWILSTNVFSFADILVQIVEQVAVFSVIALMEETNEFPISEVDSHGRWQPIRYGR